MSDIRIIFQQIQHSLNNTIVDSSLSQQFIDNLRVGQNLAAKLVTLDKQFWLVIDDVKLSIPKETTQQLQLSENQNIKLKVISLSSPVELQIIKSTVQTPKQIQAALVGQTVISQKEQPVSEPIVKTNTQSPGQIPIQANNRHQAEVTFKPQSKLLNNSSLLKQTVQTKLSTEDTKPISTEKQSSKPNASTTSVLRGVQAQSINTVQTKPPTIVPPSIVDNIKAQRDTVVSNKPTSTLQNSVAGSKTINSTVDSSTLNTKVVITNGTEVGKLIPSTHEGAIPLKTETNSKLVSNTLLPNIQQTNTTQPYKIETVETKLKPELVTHEPVKTNPIDKVLTNIKQPVLNSQKIKFEIPVVLPDKERFPLLAEKLTTAFTQSQFTGKNTGRSLSQLLSQLNRLHQWISDNKTASRTNSGAGASKSANDLRESLKDLFRYISNKDTIKTGKSIEKALRQSGTFLEKRVASQKESVVQKQQKSSSELTIHKDIKANLNRVLATALYNLAKINTTQTNPTKIPPSNQTPSNSSPSTAQVSTQSQKALSDIATSQNNNLLNNIKNRLKQFTAGRATVTNLPELELITKEVLRNVQEALSRSQLGQLTNLRPESSNQQWLFELPIMNGKTVDSFSIFLKEEDDSTDEDNNKKRRWSVVLQFGIGTLGKIRTMLSWENNKIQVRFLAEQQDTVNLVDTELEHFQKMLTEQDIIFEQLTVEQAELDELNVQFSTGTTE